LEQRQAPQAAALRLQVVPQHPALVVLAAARSIQGCLTLILVARPEPSTPHHPVALAAALPQAPTELAAAADRPAAETMLVPAAVAPITEQPAPRSAVVSHQHQTAATGRMELGEVQGAAAVVPDQTEPQGQAAAAAAAVAVQRMILAALERLDRNGLRLVPAAVVVAAAPMRPEPE
jgi:hypothetical protein